MKDTPAHNYTLHFIEFISHSIQLEIKYFFLFISIFIVTYGFQKDGMTNRSERKVKPPSISTNTNTTGRVWSIVTQSSTDIDLQTMVTIKHQDSECEDIATDYAYRSDLCAGANDPENYLKLARARYTCLGRCEEPPRHVKRFFQCGCDASCEAYKECCRDMAQVCPDLHNTGHVDYAQLLRPFTRCSSFVRFFNDKEIPFSFSTKPYEAYIPANTSKQKTFPFKSRTLIELTRPLKKYQVIDTKRKFVFANYNAYNAYKSNQSTPYFNPKVIDLTCEFVESGSSRFHSVLKVMLWCRVSQVEDAVTQYHRPCETFQMLICRCKVGQFLKDHVHNACLGRTYSKQSLYRFPLWDRQLQHVVYRPSGAETCKSREISPLGTRNDVRGDLKQLHTTMKMRILPVLIRSRWPPYRPYQDEVEGDEVIDRESDIRVIVELTNSLERRFYCPSMRSRLEDCWLEKCADGGLLLAGNISHGLPARRSCIVPAAAEVLHLDGSSGIGLCGCLRVLIALNKLGLWKINLKTNKGISCSFGFTALLKRKFITGFVFSFQKIYRQRSTILTLSVCI